MTNDLYRMDSEDKTWLRFLATDPKVTTDFMQILSQTSIDSDSPSIGDGCEYHEHRDGVDLGCKRWRVAE